MNALPDIIEQLIPVEKIALRYVLEDKLKRLDKAIKLDNEMAEYGEWFKRYSSGYIRGSYAHDEDTRGKILR